jgi:hypothetical protein
MQTSTPQTAALTPAQQLTMATHISVVGQRVTLDRQGPGLWIATGWEQGLPVARAPVTEAEVASILGRFPASIIR